MDPLRVMALCANPQPMNRALVQVFQQKNQAEMEVAALQEERRQLRAEHESSERRLSDLRDAAAKLEDALRSREETVHSLESLLRDSQAQMQALAAEHAAQSKELSGRRTEAAALQARLEELPRLRDEVSQAQRDAQRHQAAAEESRRALERSEAAANEAAIRGAEELGRLRHVVQQARLHEEEMETAVEEERRAWREERCRLEQSERTLRSIVEGHCRDSVAQRVAGREREMTVQELVAQSDPRKTQAVVEALAARVAELEADHPGPSPSSPSSSSDARYIAQQLQEAQRSLSAAQETLRVVLDANQRLEERLAELTGSGSPVGGGSHSTLTLGTTRGGTAGGTTGASRMTTMGGATAGRISEVSTIQDGRPRTAGGAGPSANDIALELAEDLNASRISDLGRTGRARASAERSALHLNASAGVGTGPSLLGMKDTSQNAPGTSLHSRSRVSVGPEDSVLRERSSFQIPASIPTAPAGRSSKTQNTNKSAIRAAVAEALSSHARQGDALMDHVDRLGSARRRYQGCYCKSEGTFSAKFPLDERGMPTSAKAKAAYTAAMSSRGVPKSLLSMRRRCPCGERDVHAGAYLMDVLTALEAEYDELHQRYQDLVARIRRTGFTEDEDMTEAQLHEALRSAVEQLELKASQLATLKKAIGGHK